MAAARTILLRLVVLLVLAELITWGAFALGLGQSLRSVLYDPDVDAAVAAYDRYLRRRDPLLGWPNPGLFGRKRLDASGARRLPAFPEPGGACVSVYGDSFAFGDELGAKASWANQLARTLGCRVANYGVNGYGTDQAYLRFRQMADDEAPVTILLIYPQNIMRSVNQFRALITGSGTFLSFKPRFLASPDGDLTLVPLPTPPKAQLPSLLADPGRYLEHEYFAPGARAGPVPVGFPYLRTLWRLMWNDQVHDGVEALVTGRPFWADYFEPDHPSRGAEVMEAILRHFWAEARERGMQPLIMMLPTPSAIDYFERTGAWAYEPIITRLAPEGIEVLNLGPPFHAALDGEPFVDLTTRHRSGGGHFNARGAKLHAAIVAAILRERALVAPATDGR
jgi:hypothetical protein